ncbi:MAG TPA: hypothetical protein VGL40_03705, partial [Bacillota bacterium]
MAVRSLRPQRVRRAFRDFSAGLNTAVDPVLLNDNESSECQSVRLDQKGTVEKMPGMTAQNVSLGPGPILGKHSFYRADGYKCLLYKHGTTLYKYDAAGGWNQVVKAGLGAGVRMRFCTYRDKVFCAELNFHPFTYTGAVLADVGGTPPHSPLVLDHKNHVFMVNPANPNELIFSELDNPDSWPVLNSLTVRGNDGDRITGYVSEKSRFLAFKERTKWQVLGDSVSNFALDGPRGHTGAVSQEVIAVTDDLVYYVSREGPAAWDLARSVEIGVKIPVELKRINQAAIVQASAHVFDGKYYLSVPVDGATSNNLCLIYDTLRMAWVPRTGWSFSTILSWAPAGIDLLYTGDSTAGLIYEHSPTVWNDNAVAIDGRWASKAWDFGFEERKTLKSIYLYLKLQVDATNVIVDVDIDYSGWRTIATLNLTKIVSVWDIAL